MLSRTETILLVLFAPGGALIHWLKASREPRHFRAIQVPPTVSFCLAPPWSIRRRRAVTMGGRRPPHRWSTNMIDPPP